MISSSIPCSCSYYDRSNLGFGVVKVARKSEGKYFRIVPSSFSVDFWTRIRTLKSKRRQKHERSVTFHHEEVHSRDRDGMGGRVMDITWSRLFHVYNSDNHYSLNGTH